MRRLLQLCFLSILLIATGWTTQLAAADSKAIAEFKKAMKGKDSSAKKKALAGLSGSDEETLALIIKAVGDRQVSRNAITALRSITGLTPSPSKNGNPGYPGYPKTDDAGGWSKWLKAKQEEAKAAAEKKKAEEDLAKLKQKVAGEGQEGTAEDEGKKDRQQNAGFVSDTSNLGKLDRIFFKDGSILSCYILLKRKDLDGNITSIRIMHKSLAGEEVLEYDLITRIEEDFR